jgi:SIR2-like domain
VTTNFDRLFEKAQKRLRWHAPPGLPDLASGAALEGLVYLHGRMPVEPTDGIKRLNFVLSSADFGRAYLADGWATRFVRELLERYVIVLLGYSANDPPVRYLLQGLHVRADKTPAKIFAFASGPEDEVQVQWRDRGVRVLSYENSDGSHSDLWNSLRAWADRADDADAWRRSVIALAQSKPRDLLPDQRGRVVSLVRSDRGAKLFVDAVPSPPAEWLCVFDRYVRYGSPRTIPGGESEIEPRPEFKLDDDPLRPAREPWANDEVNDDLLLSAVRTGARARLGSFGGRQTAALPDRLFSLAYWIGKTLNDPTSAWWAAGHGTLHDRLLDQIEWELGRPDGKIDDRARKVWSLLLEGFRHSPFDERWFDFERTLNRDGWVDSTLREFERITTPYLRVSRPYSTEPLPPEGSWHELRLGEVVSVEVKFPPEHAGKFEVRSEALPAVVRILCRGLQHAAGLLADIETRYWRTAAFQPEDKPGQTHLGGADRYLMRVVRFFDRLATEQPERARAEIGLWPTDDEFFFDKLKMYVLMNAHLFSGHECAEGILALSDRAFWDNYLRRELLHTLHARWGEFPVEERRLIEARILQGPYKWDEEEPAEYARRKASAAATIFGWLALNNCEISEDVQGELPRLRDANPDWRPSWDASADHDWEARGGSVSVDTDASKIIDVPLAEVAAVAEANTTHPFGEFIERRPFDGLVKERPRRALSVLSFEARNGRYPTWLWRSALSDWPDDTSDRLRCLFATRLVRLPSHVVFDLRHYIPRWFRSNLPKLMKAGYQRYLPLWDALVDHFFALGSEGNESSRGDISVGGKPLKRSRRTREHSIAAPVGVLIEILFDALDDLKLPRAKGIPPDIRTRLERLFDAPGEGADYAMCETTVRLRWLFYLDPKWVTKKLIPFFDLKNPRSEPAWNGYLYTTELPEPKLFALLKPNFLEAFPYSSAWAWEDGPIRRLNEFLVVACFWYLKDHRYVSYAEARAALQQATEEGREHSIWFLTRIVHDLDKWKTFGKPFVQKAWPRERKFQTSTSSRNFAHLAEEAGDQFPDVVKTILPFLGPVDHADMLIYGAKKNLASRFPEPMLALLDRVIPDAAPVPPHDLRSILEMIVVAEPTLRQDSRWLRLDTLAG